MNDVKSIIQKQRIMSHLNKTLKKGVNGTTSNPQLKKIKSCDDLFKNGQLSILDIKVLLSCNHSTSFQEQYLHQIKKQEVLERNRLFDTSRLFGLSPASSIQQSARIHSARLDSMFESTGVSKNPSSGRKTTTRKDTLIMGKSPKGYVRENKENYQKNGPTNLQKLRIKLKINKK